MVVYLILFIVYFLFGIKDLQGETEYSFRKVLLLMTPMFLLAAFRSENIGNDTAAYKFAYEFLATHETLSEMLSASRMEDGYVFLMYLSSRIGFDYYQFQIFVSALIYLPWVFFIHRYSSKPGISIFLFAVLFMAGTMNVTRMQLALSILLFSLPFIENRRPILFGLVVASAFLFHHSSLVFSLMYPISVLRNSKAMTWIIVLSATAIAYLGASFFEAVTGTLGMYESYVDGRYFDEDRSKLGVYVDIMTQIVILIFFYLRGILTPFQYKETEDEYYDEEEGIKKNIDISYFCLMAFWITFALSIVGLTNNIMSRISGYFSLSLLLLLPIAFSSYESYQKRKEMFLIIGGSYLARWIVIMVLRPYWNHIVPYESFFALM